MFTLFVFQNQTDRAAGGASFSELDPSWRARLSQAAITAYDVLVCAERLGQRSTVLDPSPFNEIRKIAFTHESDMLAMRSQLDKCSANGTAPAQTRVIATETFEQRCLPHGQDMRTLFVPVHKRHGMPREAFHAHWFGHAKLILEVVPGIRGYLQHHTTKRAYECDSDSWDGVAQFWFDSLDAVEGLPRTDPESFARVAADELAFLGSVPLENYVGVFAA